MRLDLLGLREGVQRIEARLLQTRNAIFRGAVVHPSGVLYQPALRPPTGSRVQHLIEENQVGRLHIPTTNITDTVQTHPPRTQPSIYVRPAVQAAE
jgi:hypothetical protein